MTRPRFSIAMATYNGERFLEQQLNSITRQTLAPHELVVCDDASSDATEAILVAYAEAAQFPVRIHRNETNTGHGEAFFRAASMCEGDWIAFCDQDDIWRSHKLECYSHVLAGYPQVLLLSHAAVQVDEHLKPLPYRIPDHRVFSVVGPGRNRPLGVLPGFTCCVQSEILRRVSVEGRPQDSLRPGRLQPHDKFVYHLANTYGSIARIPDSLALYRRHEATVTGEEGSGFYDRSLMKQVRSASYAQEEGFRHRAEHALEHADFYREVLAQIDYEADAVFWRRTRDAVERYERTAAAFERRAHIYSKKTGVGGRARMFGKNLRSGSYAISPRGPGLGWKVLAKDGLRVMARW